MDKHIVRQAFQETQELLKWWLLSHYFIINITQIHHF